MNRLDIIIAGASSKVLGVVMKAAELLHIGPNEVENNLPNVVRVYWNIAGHEKALYLEFRMNEGNLDVEDFVRDDIPHLKVKNLKSIMGQVKDYAAIKEVTAHLPIG